MSERQPPDNERDLPASASLRSRAGIATAVQFAGFQFDFERGQLRQGGTLIPLSPKPDALLRFFLANPQRLISKTELMDSLWPDVVVTQDSLVHCIGELRSRLGDGGTRLIATSPRRGYMFDAEVLPARMDHAQPPARRAATAAAPVQRGRWLAVAAPLCVSALALHWRSTWLRRPGGGADRRKDCHCADANGPIGRIDSANALRLHRRPPSSCIPGEAS